MPIRDFACQQTKKLFIDGNVRTKSGWSSMQQVARRKLMMIHYAKEIADLMFPPGNRLEKLKGDLAGYSSIRINDQWRIIFMWKDGAAEQVKIIDDH
jgi:proteic killer suppression protein